MECGRLLFGYRESDLDSRARVDKLDKYIQYFSGYNNVI